MSMTNDELQRDELQRRIEELQASGMTLAARALIREMNFRQKNDD